MAGQDGGHALHHAAKSGSLDVLLYLLQHCALDVDSAAVLRSNTTPLHWAASAGQARRRSIPSAVSKIKAPA